MNQARAINTLAFAVVMLSIFCVQVKNRPEAKAAESKLAALYQTQVSRVATVLALTSGHWSGNAVESDAVDANVPAARLEMASMQTVRAHMIIERNQAKLACAQHLLQTKMEILTKARETQAAARVRLVTVAESRADWQ